MPLCLHCGTKVGIFSSRYFNSSTQRCSVCDSAIQRYLSEFRIKFQQLAGDGVLTRDEWRALEAWASMRRLPLTEALQYVRDDAVELIRKAVSIAYGDLRITNDEEAELEYLMRLLCVPHFFRSAVRSAIKKLRLLTNIRDGLLPVATATIHLDPDEICHFEAHTIHIRPDLKKHQPKQGKIIASNNKLRFISARSAFEIEWKRVLSLVPSEDRVYVETADGEGGGFYIVDDPDVVEALFTHLIEKSRPTQKRESKTESQTSQITKSPYDILQISSSATREEIVIAYRHMAKLYHPDKVASLATEFKELAESRMKEINLAYKALTEAV